MLMILKSKSNHLNKGDLNQNHFGSGDLKIKIILKIKLFQNHFKYSLYLSNFDVFCLLTALAIILDCLLPVG